MGWKKNKAQIQKKLHFLILRFIEQLLFFSEAFDSRPVIIKGNIPIDFWGEFLGSDQDWERLMKAATIHKIRILRAARC